MTTTDFRALCAELLDWAEVTAAHYIQLPAVMLRARAALAEAVPEGPTREDAVAVYSQVMAAHECETLGEMAEYFARAVLARWGTPNLAKTRSSLGDAPQPVPVSERLPAPEDCDGAGRCWWFHDEDNASCSHWLPAHALPIPTAND